MTAPLVRSFLLAASILAMVLPTTAGKLGSGAVDVNLSIIDLPDPIGVALQVDAFDSASGSTTTFVGITEGPDPIPQVSVTVKVGIIEGPDPIPQVSVSASAKITDGVDPIPQVSLAIFVSTTDDADPVPQVTVVVTVVDEPDPFG